MKRKYAAFSMYSELIIVTVAGVFFYGCTKQGVSRGSSNKNSVEIGLQATVNRMGIFLVVGG